MTADPTSTKRADAPAEEPTGTPKSGGAPSVAGGVAARPLATASQQAAGPGRKSIVGTVSSDRMRKTRSVQIQRLVKHRKYGKYVQSRTTFYVHDEDEVSHVGDTVLIAETRPLSKLKRWRLVKVIAKAAGGPVVAGDLESAGPDVERGTVEKAAGEGGGSK